jgi:PHD/YefM family antitoxin component YafN of YafNO toxin-antitoxin module
MTTITATQFRSNLFATLHDVIVNNEPAHITTKDGDAIVISEDDFNAIQETLNLLAVPGMREKIITGLNTPISDCVIDDGNGW